MNGAQGTPVPDLASVVRSLPCSRCSEPTVVYILDLEGDDRPVRLCERHWRDRVALEQEMRS